MAKKKRVSRKQLLKEPDEFLTFSAKMINFAHENQNQVTYALIAIVVAVMAVFAFRYFSSVSERKAYALFEEGLAYYVGQTFNEQSAQFDEAAKGKLAKLLQDYSSTKAARLSLPLYADMNYKEGSYDKAIELYRKALEDFSHEQSLIAILWNGLAYSYEGKRDYQSALGCFQKVAELKGNFLKAETYFNIGRMHEAMNNKQKAMEAYDRVANEYANSIHGKMAKDKTLRLKG
jgi:tetratricopeptide (TPR) repeat protein